MDQNAAAFHVVQKFQAKPHPFVGALQQAGDVGDDNLPVIDFGHPQARLHGGERIVGKFWARAALITPSRVDSPVSGTPTIPTSATIFISSSSAAPSPTSPFSATRGALLRLDLKAELPRPPRPPRTISVC